MKILHTSDWHIGKSLYGRSRFEEFEAFLGWLADAIQQEEIDALLVSGDVFDSSAPSNRAQGLYYRFLCRVAESACRHVVVTGGNHDSPSFLNAPKELLKALDVHVVGSMTEDPSDEVIVLKDGQGNAELIVCAVPYLRDRDVRTAEAGESVQDKGKKLLEGIRAHYAAVGAIAEQRRGELGGGIPVVGMGHLFAAGGKVGEGERELYVGTLAQVDAGVFPACFDYTALGHLHVPQMAGKRETVRYSGSPIPMGFGEAKQQKSVCVVEFSGRKAEIGLLEVPLFQKLEGIRGGWEEISTRILELSVQDSDAWLEVAYDGAEVLGDLRERLEGAVAGTKLEILRIRNHRLMERVLSRQAEEETLDELDVMEVFQRCLAAHEVPEEQRGELVQTYKEVVDSLHDAAEDLA